MLTPQQNSNTQLSEGEYKGFALCWENKKARLYGSKTHTLARYTIATKFPHEN